MSAFIVSDHTFDLLWEVLLRKLDESGEARGHAAAKYFRKNVFFPGDEDLWDAEWRSSLQQVPPGYSTFSSNSLEAHWKVLDYLHSGKDKKSIAAHVFKEIQKDCRLWAKDKVFAAVKQHPMQPSVELLRGDGTLACRDRLCSKGFRRYTVKKLLAEVAGGDVMLDVTEDFATSS